MEKKRTKTKMIRWFIIIVVTIFLLIGGGIIYIMKSTGINRIPNKIEFFTDDQMQKMQEENQDGENEVIVGE